jgi:outer membrane protein OmpA-like peptidoglycan-associated protein
MTARSFKRAHARRLARERRRLGNAKRRAMVGAATLTASALFAASAQAAGNTYTVTTTGDDSGAVPSPACTGSGGSYTCSTLRDAIYAANADHQPDTITFASGLSGTITLGSKLTISDYAGVTIDGPGPGTLKIDGAGNHQIFYINASDRNPFPPVTISGLTMADGNSGATPGGAIDVSRDAALSLNNDVISGSTSNADGGGVFSHGSLSVTDSTITGNTASDGGAITEAYSHIAVKDSQLTHNQATRFGGGAIAAYLGSLSLTGTTVSQNTSAGVGGGILSFTEYGTTIKDSTLSGNTAGAGGGLFVGQPEAYKYNPLTVANSTISDNQAQDGAGIDISSDAQLSPTTITHSTLSGNQAGSKSFGGGLLIEGNVDSAIDVVDSTISGNSAADGGGVSLGYDGSHAFFGSPPGSVAFENSTIAANTASASGGGIYLGQYNTGSGDQSATAKISSTIVAGNTAAGSAEDLARPSTSTSGGFDAAFSLIQHPGSAPFLSQQSDITGVDPQLGPLQNNGGPTETMMPSATSPVIDQGKAATDLTTDQRFDPRTVDVSGIANPPGGDGTDIGAVELPAPPPSTPPPSPAGFSASVRGQLIGGPTTPLIVRGITLVNCSVKTGTLTSCSIRINAPSGKLLARGTATSSTPVKSLSMYVTATDWGRVALFHHQLGITDPATVTGQTSASGAQTATGNVKFVSRSVKLQIGKRSAKLSRHLLGELDQVAKLLIDSGAKGAKCTAYSDTGTDDRALTKAQAKAACKALTDDGFTGAITSVGAGHTHALEPNTSAANRAKNRRLVIRFKF